MKKTAQKLRMGDFESSSVKTEEFLSFSKEFKKEFKKEMKTVNVSDITFSIGHFYISGFFTKEDKTFYFSLSDVRSPQYKMLYRTAKDKKDYTGGANQYVNIEDGMSKKMNLD